MYVILRLSKFSIKHYLLTYLLTFYWTYSFRFKPPKSLHGRQVQENEFFSEKILGRIFLFFYRTRSRVRKQLCLVLFVVFNSHVQTPLFDRGKGHLREPVLPTAEASHETL